ATQPVRARSSSAISPESRSGPNILWWTKVSSLALVRIHIRRATRPKASRKPQSSRSRAANTGLVPAVLGGNEPPPQIALTSRSGHKQTFRRVRWMSALPPKANIRVTHHHVRYGPQAENPPLLRA